MHTAIRAGREKGGRDQEKGLEKGMMRGEPIRSMTDRESRAESKAELNTMSMDTRSSIYHQIMSTNGGASIERIEGTRSELT